MIKKRLISSKSIQVNVTMPIYLKESLKQASDKKGIPLNEFIRDALKVAIRELS